MLGKLVNYSGSSSDDEDDTQTSKRKASPPAIVVRKLPNPFQRAIVKDEEYDDTTEHQGRTRNFPHERGNWVSYVYIQCPVSDGITQLQNQIIHKSSEKQMTKLELHTIDDLHLSVTKTFVLRHHWIDEFVRTTETHLKCCSKLTLPLSTIKIYCNENRSRTFISLAFVDAVSMNQQYLCDIVARLDQSLGEFNLPSFYKDPSFHVSLLWCLGDRENDLMALLPELCAILEQLTISDSTDFIINVDKLHCKIGNKLFSFQLKP